jgi:hypothetical protein
VPFRHRPTHAFNSTVHLFLEAMCVGEKLQAMPEYADPVGRSAVTANACEVLSGPRLTRYPTTRWGTVAAFREASRERVGTQLRTPAIAHH